MARTFRASKRDRRIAAGASPGRSKTYTVTKKGGKRSTVTARGSYSAMKSMKGTTSEVRYRGPAKKKKRRSKKADWRDNPRNWLGH